MESHSYCPWCMSELPEGQTVCPSCGHDSLACNTKEHQLAPGTILHDRYVLGRVLGQGGFGITYIGLDLMLHRRVAVKEFFTPSAGRSADGTVYTYADDGSLERGRDAFIREARAMSRASVLTTAVADARDVFAERGTAYLVMDYVEGVTLGEWALGQPGGKVSSATLLPLLLPTAEALEALHAAGVVHRDISPTNILVDTERRAHLIDFGLARGYQASNLTTAVNPSFAPVEQWTGSGQGPWTDVYALCATIYVCLTGVVPPSSVERISADTLVPPRTAGADLTEGQEEALLRGLAPQPNDRTRSMGELLRTLFREAGGEAPRALGGPGDDAPGATRGDSSSPEGVPEMPDDPGETTPDTLRGDPPAPKERQAQPARFGEGIIVELSDGEEGPQATVELHNESEQTIVGVTLMVHCYDEDGFAIFSRGTKDVALAAEGIEVGPSCSASSIPVGPLPDNAASVTIVGARLRTSDGVLHQASELFGAPTSSDVPRTPRTHGTQDMADHVVRHPPVVAGPARGSTAKARPRASGPSLTDLPEADAHRFTTLVLFAILLLALVFVASRNLSTFGETMGSGQGDPEPVSEERAEEPNVQPVAERAPDAEDGQETTDVAPAQDDAEATPIDEGTAEVSADADDQQAASPAILPGDAAQGFETFDYGDLWCKLPGGYEEYEGDDRYFDKRFYVYDRGDDEWEVILSRYSMFSSPTTYDELLQQYQDVRNGLYADDKYVTDYVVNTGFIALGGLLGLDSYAEHSGPNQPHFGRTLDIYCYHQDEGRSVHYQVDVTWLKDEPWFSQDESYWDFLGVVDESLISIPQT